MKKKNQLDDIILTKECDDKLITLLISTLEKINKIMKKPDYSEDINYTLTFNLQGDFYASSFNKLMTPRNVDCYYKYEGFNNVQKKLLDGLYRLIDFKDRTYFISSTILYDFIKENKKEINYIEFNKKFLMIGVSANIRGEVQILRNIKFNKTSHLMAENDNFKQDKSLCTIKIEGYEDIIHFVKYRGIMDLYYYDKKNKILINKKLKKTDYDFTLRISNKYIAGNSAEMYNDKKKEAKGTMTFSVNELYNKNKEKLDKILSYNIIIDHEKYFVMNQYIAAYL